MFSEFLYSLNISASIFDDLHVYTYLTINTVWILMFLVPRPVPGGCSPCGGGAPAEAGPGAAGEGGVGEETAGTGGEGEGA